MQSNPSKHCHHVKTSGIQCGSPALRNGKYCYYHQRSRPVLLNLGDDKTSVPFFMPVLEDAHAIQVAIRNVAVRLLDQSIDTKTAGLMFYALQIASSNLKHMKAEAPQPEQVVVDVPKLSEIAPPTPTAETRPLNSHTNLRTHFDQPPSAEDEYRDDAKRQEREVREHIIQGNYYPDESAHLSPADDSPGSNPQKAPEHDPEDDLTPGTIQARATRKEYII